ncbi:AroB1 [Desulforapulum autotrophicum HRM2]|uniref:3-dehydroquinate synthase n=1 Tax=Desulforapulum autotrophicum (strain ATCC 43914 / DSM 3382 / VKM B-1955 / HRM2) TaxID=177437 RepID=C0QIT2_DESAH|nr:3-dehydroquinate synthase [Desulforapulum autotrophicum]ACN13722.1 AroB1 [Desulforapulum autotrophicum HRM2]
MKKIDITGRNGSSCLAIGERLENLGAYIPEQTIIITDSQVRSLYGDQFPACPVIEIGRGEAIKTLETVQTIFQRLVELEVDRSGFIVGIGGGIVCDITGFVASTYLRGLRFGFVSTTLLSQVDASVGGKNGVNFSGYKNMVGVFNQPEFVVCDMALLKTLPQREIASGLGEIIKHACIEDMALFEFLETSREAVLGLDPGAVERMVHDSVLIKSAIVNRDEHEHGERRKLNFGHTFGHAFEKILKIPHGEAVAAGMVVAAALSVEQGYLNAEAAQRIENLVGNLHLPTRFTIDRGKVMDAMRRDKKRQGESINFVLLAGIGKAVVESIPIEALERLMDRLNLC